MSDIAWLLGYIIYITSHDCDEPLHVHVIASEHFGSEKMASKIWIGQNGTSKIAKVGGDISNSKLRKIAKMIERDRDLFNKIKDTWCSLFCIEESQIDFYKNTAV